MDGDAEQRSVGPLPVSWPIALLDAIRGVSGWSILCLPLIFVGFLVIVTVDEVRFALGGARVLESAAGDAAAWALLGSGATVSGLALLVFSVTWVLTGWVRLATAWRTADQFRPAADDRVEISLTGAMRLRNLLVAVGLPVIGISALGFLAIGADALAELDLPAVVFGIGAGILLLAALAQVTLVRWEMSLLARLRRRWPTALSGMPPGGSGPGASGTQQFVAVVLPSGVITPDHGAASTRRQDRLRTLASYTSVGAFATLVLSDLLESPMPQLSDAAFVLFVLVLLVSGTLWILWGTRMWLQRVTRTLSGPPEKADVEQYLNPDPVSLPSGVCALLSAAAVATSLTWSQLTTDSNPIVPADPLAAGTAFLLSMLFWGTCVAVRAGGVRRTMKRRARYLAAHPDVDPWGGGAIPHVGLDEIRGWMRAGESDL